MMTIVTILLLLVFLGLTFAMGLTGQRTRRGDFFLAGRRADSWSVGASLLATCLGASATVGIVGRAYSMGWSAFWWLGSGAVGLVILGAFFVHPMRERVGVRTLPEWLGTRYGTPARMLAAVLILIMWIGVISAQWVAAGSILGSLLGIPGGWAVGIAAVVVIAYTAAGGQLSVLRTDLLQVVFIGLAVILPHLFLPARNLGAMPSLRGLFLSGGLSFHQWFALLVVVGGMYVVGPDLCSRVLTGRDDAAARRGAWMAAPALLAASIAIVWLGIRIRELGIVPDAPRNTFAALLGAEGLLPTPVGTIIQIGLLGALLSSADTCLHTAASVTVLDVIPARPTDPESEAPHRPSDGRHARIAVVLIGLAAAAVAHWHPGIIRNMLLAYSFYAGGLLLPLLLMATPRLAERIPRIALWCAMVAGGILPVAVLLTQMTTDYALAGFYGCCLAGAILLPAGAVALRGTPA